MSVNLTLYITKPETCITFGEFGRVVIDIVDHRFIEYIESNSLLRVSPFKIYLNTYIYGCDSDEIPILVDETPYGTELGLLSTNDFDNIPLQFNESTNNAISYIRTIRDRRVVFYLT